MTLPCSATELTTIKTYNNIVLEERGMTIQKTNINFGATIKGDVHTLIKNAVRKGLSKNLINSSFDMIHNACPKKEDKVYLYCRKRYGMWDIYEGIRSGVKVYKDGVLLEKNIDPRAQSPKYLFHKFAITVKNLVSGKIKPDDTVKLYN